MLYSKMPCQFPRRLLLATVAAPAALTVLGAAAAAPLPEVECLATGQNVLACEEEQVERAEDHLAEAMGVRLLQVDIARTTKDRGHKLAGQRLADHTPAKASEERLSAGVDSTALLRAGVRHDQAAIIEVGAEGEVGAAGAKVEATQAPEVNCSQYAMFCDPKVNCAAEPITAADRAAWNLKLATPGGHANLRSWCLAYPLYATSLQKCVLDADPIGYAHATYESQRQANLLAADAVYCFVAGHCNNTQVTLNTTQQEAEAICDEKYGHERWTSVGWQEFMGVLSRAQQLMADGTKALREHRMSWGDLVKLARQESEISAMTACAMGNYHCDVFYCQQNYCQSEVYKRFARLSWAY